MLTLSDVSPAETSLTVAHKRDTANNRAKKDRITHIMRIDLHKDPSSATHIELNVRASSNRSLPSVTPDGHGLCHSMRGQSG